MISAIGSSPLFSTVAAGTQTAVLKSQLAQYEIKLSDCVHCASASTREGKEKIQSLSEKISVVKARIEKIEVAKPTGQSAMFNETTTAVVAVNHDALEPRPVNTTVGTLLDVFS
jgi:hypothetical protein